MPEQPPPVSAEELRVLVALAKRVIEGPPEVRQSLQGQGVTVLPANRESTVPLLADIEASFEFKSERGPYDAAALFNPQVMADFLGELDKYADEFDPPTEGNLQAPDGFFWQNPSFSWSDAMAYYCVLRHFQPLCIVEIGSGFSTLVALQAVKRNRSGEIWCVEPFPRPWLEKVGGIHLVKDHPQNLGLDFFTTRLSHEGDVLSIDSTHTVKAGSDCLQIYLRILPAIHANIVVHAHDIYLPFPMPKGFAVNQQRYWTEQYLLYAYLLDNPKTQVLFGSAYHSKFNGDRLEALMRGRKPSGGASLWFRLLGKARRVDNRF